MRPSGTDHQGATRQAARLSVAGHGRSLGSKIAGRGVGMTRRTVKWVLVALCLATGACDRAPDVPSSSTKKDGAPEVPGSAPEKATGPIGSTAMAAHGRTR